MAKGAIRKKPLKVQEQFVAVDNFKLKMSLSALVDKYSEKARALIYTTYNDDHLMGLYRAIRNAGIYEKGGPNRRKLVEFPNGWVYDFVDTVLSEVYGPNWLNDKRALKHELVKPWWVVEHL